MFRISQSAVSSWPWLHASNQEKPPENRLERNTIWKGLDVKIFTFLLKKFLTRINTYKVFIFNYVETVLFSLIFTS